MTKRKGGDVGRERRGKETRKGKREEEIPCAA